MSSKRHWTTLSGALLPVTEKCIERGAEDDHLKAKIEVLSQLHPRDYHMTHEDQIHTSEGPTK
jgi:hypothetical protein